MPEAAGANPEAAVVSTVMPILEVRLVVRGTPDDQMLTIREPGKYELGRAAAATLRIEHPTMSRRQASIVLNQDRSQVIVESMSETNPTRVNGSPVTRPLALGHGDIVEVGALKIEVVIKRSQAASTA